MNINWYNKSSITHNEIQVTVIYKKITVSKELHFSAHESHLQAYKYGTSKTKKVQLDGILAEIW